MYCSNCGLKLNDKKIHKALENDAKNANNIKYLAKSLISMKKYSAKNEIYALKNENLENFAEQREKITNNFKEDIAFIKTKLHENDLEYFKNALHVNEKRTLSTHDYYVCPRCGKLVKNELSENDVKSLARAGHSEIHRGRNNISSGMCGLMIGLILAIIGFMFLALSFKATNGGVLDTGCVEFFVFIVLLILGVVLIVYALANLIYGKRKIRNYEGLLRDINNGAFHQ